MDLLHLHYRKGEFEIEDVGWSGGIVSYEEDFPRHVWTSNSVFHSEFCLSLRLLSRPKRGIMTIYDSAYKTPQGLTFQQAKGHHIYTSVSLRLLWNALLFFSEALGSGQTHTLELPPLKQIMQGLIYLSKHRDPRRTANHFPGGSENLEGEREASPVLSIRWTAQSCSLPPRSGAACVSRHLTPRCGQWP